MTYMLCPLCRGKVIGGGLDELSQDFTEHLRSVHRITDLPQPMEGKVVRPLYDSHDKNSVGARYAEPGVPAALVPDRQEVTDFAVRCPFCLTVVRGRNEIDLGVEVREHWSEDHGIHPRLKLAAPLEWGGRGRQ